MTDLYIAWAVITILSIIPVAVWKVSRKLTGTVLGMMIFFYVIHSNFLKGYTGAAFDTLWSYQAWAAVIDHWMRQGVTMDWNPYNGAGQPFALYNNIYPYGFFAVFSELFRVLGLKLSQVEFFNVIWVFGFFNIITGFFLLSLLLIGDAMICLIGFASMLLGGMFFAEVQQPAAFMTISFLPYLIFLSVLYFRSRNPASIVLMFTTLGLAVNFYIPLYLALIILSLLVSFFLFYGYCTGESMLHAVERLAQPLKARPMVVVACIALFLLQASPMMYSYKEMGDYVSPTRGFTSRGEIASVSDTGYQITTPAPLALYTVLFNRPPSIKPQGEYHAFYIGILPSIMLFASMFMSGNWIFIFAAAIVAVLGSGAETPLWEFLLNNIPALKMMRHTFAFAKAAGMFALIASLYGLFILKNPSRSTVVKLSSVLAASIYIFSLLYVLDYLNYSLPTQMIIVVVTGVVLFFLATVKEGGGPITGKRVMALLFALHLIDLTGFSFDNTRKMAPGIEIGDIGEITYPVKWETFLETSFPMPYDRYPMFVKKSVWLNKKPNQLYLLQKDFAGFTGRHKLFEKKLEGPIFSFIPADQGADINAEEKRAVESMFSGQPGNWTDNVRADRSLDPNAVTVHVDAPGGGYVLRMENYHSGWSATIDGMTVPIERTVNNFQMVYVPNGAQTVSFRFETVYPKLAWLHCISLILGWFCFQVILATAPRESAGVLRAGDFQNH